MDLIIKPNSMKLNLNSPLYSFVVGMPSAVISMRSKYSFAINDC